MSKALPRCDIGTPAPPQPPQTHLTVQGGYGVHVLAAGAASRHRRATPAPPGPAPGLWEPSHENGKPTQVGAFALLL
jgi:hypothetical protein